jgi:peptide/nickel transport system substrate-binding protein
MSYQVILDPSDQRVFDLIRVGEAKIGIQLVAKPAAGSGFNVDLNANNKRDFDSALDCWTGTIDPDFMLSQATCAAIKSYTETAYCNAEYDRLYRLQSTQVNATKRLQTVYKMQEILFRDKPNIWYYASNTIEAWSKHWTGFPLGPQGSINYISKLTLEQVHQVG